MPLCAHSFIASETVPLPDVAVTLTQGTLRVSQEFSSLFSTPTHRRYCMKGGGVFHLPPHTLY